MAGSEVFPSRGFLRYWRADAVSGFGSYVTVFALQTLVVLTLHGSAADVGWLNAARWLPYLVLGLFVGAMVDRRRRLPLMVTTDLLQAVLLLCVPLLWWLDLLSLPALLLVVLAYGSVSVVNAAAAISLLPRLVEPRYLQPAHARVDGADAVSATAGPALGGLLVSAIGAPLAVLVDSLSYVYSAITLRGIVLNEPAALPAVTARGLLREVTEGVRWIYRGSGLSALELSNHIWFVGHAVVGVVLAPYVLRTLDLSAMQFGIIGAVGGAGAVLGATVTTRVGRCLGTGRTIIVCHLLSAIGVVAMVLAGQNMAPAGTVTVLALGQCLYGLAMGMSNSHQMSYRQLVTPDELQSRTNTTLRSINRAVIVVVAPLAGTLADAWGMRPMLVLAAAIFAIVAAGLAASPFRDAQAPV